MIRQRSAKAGSTVEKAQGSGTASHKFRRTPKTSAAIAPILFVAFIGIAILFLVVLASGGIQGLRGRDPQPNVVMNAKIHKFTPTPEQHKRTFWVEQAKINEPIIRAFRDRKWTKVNDFREAQFVWTYSPDDANWEEPFHPWQRTNHIPEFSQWNRKDKFVKGFLEYERRVPGKDHYFNPETFMLADEDQREKFSKLLTRGGGMNHPWVLKEGNVNQGRGITMVAPNSKELRNVLEDNPADDSNLVIQRYVCNELTWNRRKYDVRMFWLVASIDPLLVLYHDGYVRIGNAVYDESDFSNTRNHLTTHTKLAEEGKATFDEFKQHVRDHNRAANLGISDPVAHVRNQFKEAIGETVAAFKDKSFTTKNFVEENGIGFYGADFILDQSLDVYFLEPQMGCGLDEDYNFRIEMHDQLFRTMVDIIDEILEKQEKGENLLPIRNPGFWQVVYADGWIYKFDGYERSKNKKGCSLPQKSAAKEEFKESEDS